MTGAGNICYLILQALDDLHGLRKVALVRNLYHISPDALVVFGEDGRNILHS